MPKEFSYGIIPLYSRGGSSYEVLLVQRKNGTWGFPKGHREGKESPKQTAQRELYEETGLNVSRRMSSRIWKEQYTFVYDTHQIDKTVGYFLAEVSSQHITLQYEELQDFVWVSIQDLQNKLSFPEIKKIASQIQCFLFKLPSPNA